MAKYKIKEPENEELFLDLAVISHNLRYYSKIWKAYYGSLNRTNMIYWENKMDEWLKLNIDYSEKTDTEPVTEVKNRKWAERLHENN